MNTLAAHRAPLMFAVSGDESIPGLQGHLSIARDAAGIVVITARRLGRSAEATLGPHVMSPPWLPTAPLEAQVEKLLRGRLELTSAQRVPGTSSLPRGLIGNGAAIVVVTVNQDLGLEKLHSIGRTLRPLRDAGIVIVAIGNDGAGVPDRGGMAGTMALLLAATFEDDRLAELGTRSGTLGFILLPEVHDAIGDPDPWWQCDAAGEMPGEVLDQLRPFMVGDDSEGEGTTIRGAGYRDREW